MTEGEKMVWAAAYAARFMEEANKARDEIFADLPSVSSLTPTPHKPDIARCIEMAWAAVAEMREARDWMVRTYGEDHGVTVMMKEMMK